jgi:uncharacterized glyoxalase superfamily protein PhnB
MDRVDSASVSMCRATSLPAQTADTDVNALHDTLQAAGAHIRQAPRDEPWAMRSLIVSDLDGNLICFASNLTSF